MYAESDTEVKTEIKEDSQQSLYTDAHRAVKREIEEEDTSLYTDSHTTVKRIIDGKEEDAAESLHAESDLLVKREIEEKEGTISEQQENEVFYEYIPLIFCLTYPIIPVPNFRKKSTNLFMLT